ncbi:hypothetical protein B9Q04_05135 [Candidatus Marsarchaeota G2 archaeon BE_D]|uniref:Uncharacterized protein n=1 Tax=Candidatus Marsarchaeota G2 archaeon BE_D TaxID=1978158 RepID=A0A2R6CCF3_9ARCH|nr:MAG: hypothetical protein B9Q04_05135 [Candidatus Marsarchaeota G2 archaeon BE_D]
MNEEGSRRRSFESKLGELIAVDSWCGGSLCLGCAGRLHNAVWFVVLLTRKTLRFPRRLRTRCLDNPVILTHQTLWYHE